MKTPFGKLAAGRRLERMKSSPRWRDGGGFRNVSPPLPGLRSGMMPSVGEFLCGGNRRTPRAPLPSIDPRERWTKPNETGLRATWLGHSTVLVEIDGLRVLTDPVWGERASPLRFAGPKRFQPVPIPISALPPIDVVMISHDHYDHLDYPTILELARLDVPFVTSLGVGAHLESWGIAPEHIHELDWWETYQLPRGELSITATPSRHFSGRGPGSRNATLWSSLSVRGRRHSFFFSGDTGLTPEYGEIRERFGRFDLVMLEVGAFHPAWGDIHLGPENALRALDLLGGGAFLPIHWGTFNLALHAWDEPAETLLALAPKGGVQLLMPKLGESVEPSRVDRIEAWWRAIVAVEEPSAHAQPSETAPSESIAEQAIGWPMD